MRVSPKRAVAVAAVTLLGVGAATARMALSLDADDSSRECAPQAEARYALLRRSLPASGIVGFAGPVVGPKTCRGIETARAALAPVIVTPFEAAQRRLRARSRDREWVAQDFPSVVVVDDRIDGWSPFLHDHPAYVVVAALPDGLCVAAVTTR